MVIWIVGLSASGKSTIGERVFRHWRAIEPNTVFVDGDEIRRLFGFDQSATCYTVAGRLTNARRIQAVCQWLDRQDVNVVCSILALFPEVLEANRSLYSGYQEVYVDVSLEKAMQRDTKNLYARARRGELKNVVGVDIPFVPPAAPDMVVSNMLDDIDMDQLAERILASAGIEGGHGC